MSSVFKYIIILSRHETAVFRNSLSVTLLMILQNAMEVFNILQHFFLFVIRVFPTLTLFFKIMYIYTKNQ